MRPGGIPRGDPTFEELFRSIGLTYLERTSGPPRSTLTLFDGNAREMLTYAKVHLCPWDPPDNVCAAGDDFAELILTPNACDLDDVKSGVGDVRIAQFRARAFENLVAVGMVNHGSPQQDGHSQDGHSVAFYPDGSTILLAGADEGIIMADIDLDRVREWRRREARRDEPRCPEKYGAIASVNRRRPF